jgi:hypothetical protein
LLTADRRPAKVACFFAAGQGLVARLPVTSAKPTGGPLTLVTKNSLQYPYFYLKCISFILTLDSHRQPGIAAQCRRVEACALGQDVAGHCREISTDALAASSVRGLRQSKR